jgi:Domain of unknown function (DUF4249)
MFAACISPYDIDTSSKGGQLVINGRITNLKEQQPIRIQVTSASGLGPLVTGAKVIVIEDSFKIYELSEESPGSYYFPNSVVGIPGHSYQLKITLLDGRTFSSKSETMPVANGTGKTTYQIIEKEAFDAEGTVTKTPTLQLVSDITLEKAGLYMRWDISETYYLSPTNFPDAFNDVPDACYVTNVIGAQNYALFNGTDSKLTSVNQLEIGERVIDNTFAERHAFSIYQTSITQESFEYWRKIRLLLSQAGSIFDTPPAPIKGNISNEIDSNDIALGFFEAANVTINRFRVFPYDFPFIITQPCTYDPDQEIYLYTEECLNCLSLPNSTYTIPDWFLD